MANFSAQTLKMLWGRAAARCAIPECRRHLVEDATETDDETLIGENCHIVAESTAGPRHDAGFPTERLDKYGNLILLCRVHHRIVDTQINSFPAERLHEIKAMHEAWVKDSLTDYDPARQRDDERYAEIVDEWIKRCHVNDWTTWTSWILGTSSSLTLDIDADLEQAREWLLTRFWPARYAKIEESFQNFRHILSDFQNKFHEHARKRGDELETERFYKLKWHDDESVYNRLVLDYEGHIDLVDDLCAELTRAANYILVCVRYELIPRFRETEGMLSVQRGPDESFRWRTYVPRYSPENLKNDPIYPGLAKFMEILPSRDFYFSELKVD